MVRLLAIFFGAILLASGGQAHSHGGRVDGNGCHADQSVFSLNDYHCHRGTFKGQTYRSKRDFQKKHSHLQSDTAPPLRSCPKSPHAFWHDCIGTRIGTDGGKYVGPFKNNKKNGKGIWTRSDLGVFVGEYSNDVADGLGTWVFPSGDIYTGEFKNDVYHGKGIFSYANGTTYAGFWKNEKRNDYGIWRHFSGDTYAGEYRNNKKNGMGRFQFKDGTTREGIWESDQFKRSIKISETAFTRTCPSSNSRWNNCFGIGDLSWSFRYGRKFYKSREHRPQKGHIYLGEFRKGVPHGQGAMINPDNSGYVGLWENGSYSGYGTFRSRNQTYAGEWKDNAPHGIGTLTYGDGEVITGTWEKGLLKRLGVPTENAVTATPPKITDTEVPSPTVKADVPSGERLALVIGNGSYHVGALDNPVQDARLIARTLRKYGFKVDVVEDADRNEFLIALDRFEKKLETAKPGTAALFYYSGHGVQWAGRNFLIPVDIENRKFREIDYETKTISADRVLAAMGHAGEGVKIILLDACRNSPFRSYTKSGTKGLGLARIDAPDGTIIGYATKAGAVAVDGDGANSPYVQGLVRYMNTPGLKIEEVLKKTRVWVLEMTDGAQRPVEENSLTGDFYFRKAITSGE